MACVEPWDWAPAISIAACPLPIAHAPGKRTTSLQSLGRTLSLRSAPSSGASTKQNTRAETFAALPESQQREKLSSRSPGAGPGGPSLCSSRPPRFLDGPGVQTVETRLCAPSPVCAWVLRAFEGVRARTRRRAPLSVIMRKSGLACQRFSLCIRRVGWPGPRFCRRSAVCGTLECALC